MEPVDDCLREPGPTDLCQWCLLPGMAYIITAMIPRQMAA